MKKVSAKTAVLILVLMALIGAGGLFLVSKKQKKISYKTVDVALRDIVQTVSETGTVKPISEINLSFLNSGKIQRQNFKVGDMVKEGQLMAELDYASFVISKQEAQANYEVATENLNKLLSGASGEERKIAEATVRQAEASNEAAKNEMNKVRTSAQESIAQAQETLHDLEDKGADTPTVQEQAITTAENNLANAKTSYQQTINNSRDSALLTISDKISLANTSLDAVNRILTDDVADDFYGLKNPASIDLAKSSYRDAQEQKQAALTDLNNARLSQSDPAVSKSLTSAINLLDDVINCLNNAFSVLNYSVTSNTFRQSDIDAYKATVNGQLSQVNAAMSLVKAAEQSYKNAMTAYNTNVKSASDALDQAKSAYNTALISAKNGVNTAKASADQQIAAQQSRISATEESLEVAKAQRDKVLAGADSHDVSLYRAKIRQAQAALDSINKQIENSQIKATFDGQVTAVNYKVGEQINAGQPAFTLLGNGTYKIEVLISEADINKVKINDETEITLDAFGDDKKFTGTVYFIEPAETVIQDVIYYRVDIKFDPGKDIIKPGMTANITITTNKKANVFSIPSRAIVDKGSEGLFVKLLVDKKEKEQKVITGLRGDEGDIEIVEGLQVGDAVITQTIEK